MPDEPGLADLPWAALPPAPAVLVPLGSTEQHGPHLPLHTDTTIATAVAEGAAARLRLARPGEPMLVAPAIAYGASGEHQGFPGTASIGTDALTLLLVELVRSLSLWAGRIVIVNGHGGNLRALAAAVPQMRDEGHDVAWAPCTDGGGDDTDAHAGRTETSLMLHLAPHLVDLSLAEPGTLAPLADLMPEIMARGVAGVSPSGVLGDPTSASPEEGRLILGRMAGDVAARILRGRADRGGHLRTDAATCPT
ncbi:mycofactocin system creatininase family protein [Acrocarpospora pleiomorpha]|uniref:Mycofactocin system creatininase family protein n=1 Tax=Acrocarpospora pleiomorpha TaxID=90975 RepID=A0A5M3X790_9ACTN|nr:mycofactocin biosynthesis peptidyl-dipeptidase MftE [Acrocarpospora pleiomorpha]GES17545.1 mycofactocin system creatininase family protein [Acrocarpospora pleiomorpha]